MELEKKARIQDFERILFDNISLLNTIGNYYSNNKLEKNIIYPKLSIYIDSLVMQFHGEIIQLLTTQNYYGKRLDNCVYFLDLMEEVGNKNNNKYLIEIAKAIRSRI
ncbi:MAG: hypothetical protein M1479_09310 [Actinobacteria bacterium]|nr:hypothetical protein [Actinomycetota bacterium]